MAIVCLKIRGLVKPLRYRPQAREVTCKGVKMVSESCLQVFKWHFLWCVLATMDHPKDENRVPVK